jgi:hypothetical protein
MGVAEGCMLLQSYVVMMMGPCRSPLRCANVLC